MSRSQCLIPNVHELHEVAGQSSDNTISTSRLLLGKALLWLINTKCSKWATAFPWIEIGSRIKPGSTYPSKNRFNRLIVSVSTLPWFEPGWLWTMKLIKLWGLNRGFMVFPIGKMKLVPVTCKGWSIYRGGCSVFSQCWQILRQEK